MNVSSATTPQMLGANRPVSPEEYSRSRVEHESAIRTLEDTVARLESEERSTQSDMYGSLSMQEAVTNDMKRATAALRSTAITMGVGFSVAAAAGYGCIAAGSSWLGLLTVASGLIAVGAMSTRKRAQKAIADGNSMKQVVEKCIADGERRNAEVTQGLQTARSGIVSHRAQLELIEVARRVSAAPTEGGTITQDDQAVRIGNVTVPRKSDCVP